jgi:predicted transposase YbfD/YdcC
MRLSQPMTSTEDRACRPIIPIPAATPHPGGRYPLARLAAVPDPRDQRGRRHTLVGMLAVAAAAVLAGARSVTAIAEWAADAPPHVLAALGARGDPLSGTWQAPSAATIRRVLARIDADLLDHTLGAWLAGRLRPPGRHRRRAIAVDGKTLRGSADHDGNAVKLLAAMDHTDGAVVAQRKVDTHTNEITLFQPLGDRLDLTDVVVTADALHAQRAHAEYLAGRPPSRPGGAGGRRCRARRWRPPAGDRAGPGRAPPARRNRPPFAGGQGRCAAWTRPHRHRPGPGDSAAGAGGGPVCSVRCPLAPPTDLNGAAAAREAGAAGRGRHVRGRVTHRPGTRGRRLGGGGLTAKAIGQRLHIGERTVETHLAHAYAKLGVRSRWELARLPPATLKPP